jgi:hypothetical protein
MKSNETEREYYRRFTQRLADLGYPPHTALSEFLEWTELDPENTRTPERDAEEVHSVLSGLPMKAERGSELSADDGSVAVADDMACALWECSKIRHGLFTPVEFIPLAAGVLREYLAKKTSNDQDHP